MIKADFNNSPSDFNCFFVHSITTLKMTYFQINSRPNNVTLYYLHTLKFLLAASRLCSLNRNE